MSKRLDTADVEPLPQDRKVSRDEVCVQCRIDAVLLDALVEHGVLETTDADGFRQLHIVRITRAVRVMHDFDVNVGNLALVVDLLDKLDTQRRELALLRKLATSP